MENEICLHAAFNSLRFRLCEVLAEYLAQFKGKFDGELSGIQVN
jgi:hypothetical protein